MKRYKNITQSDVYESWNKLRDALLAAKNGKEVDEIIKAIFTDEEKLQIGRRILIAEGLSMDMKISDICDLLKVGKNTVQHVSRRLDKYKVGFDLIDKRSKKLEKDYESKKYTKVGGSKLFIKQKKYTGIKRSDIER